VCADIKEWRVCVRANMFKYASTRMGGQSYNRIENPFRVLLLVQPKSMVKILKGQVLSANLTPERLNIKAKEFDYLVEIFEACDAF